MAKFNSSSLVGRAHTQNDPCYPASGQIYHSTFYSEDIELSLKIFAFISNNTANLN